MTYVDIDINGVDVEEDKSFLYDEPFDNSSLLSNISFDSISLKKVTGNKYFRFSVVACFCAVSAFVIADFIKSSYVIKQDIIKVAYSLDSATKDAYKVKDTSNIAKSLSEIAPAAGGDELDDLLEWEATDQALNELDSLKEAVKPESSNNSNNVAKSATSINKLESNKQVNTETIAVDNNKLEKLERKIENLVKQKDKKDPLLVQINRQLVNVYKDMTGLRNQVTALSAKVVSLEKKLNAQKALPASESKSGVTAPVEGYKNYNKEWIFKASRGNMVWIEQAGSGSIKGVKIGDEMPDLGKIKDIGRYRNGKWFVKGEDGFIEQY